MDGCQLKNLVPSKSNFSEWRRVTERAKTLFELGDAYAGREEISRSLEQLGGVSEASWSAELVALRWACRESLLLPRAAVGAWRDLVRRGGGRVLAKDRAKVYFYFAEYLDSMFQQEWASKEGAATRGRVSAWDLPALAAETIRSYLQALKNDTAHKRVLLTINRVLEIYSTTTSIDAVYQSVKSELSKGWREISPWVWYAALPQLVPKLLTVTGEEEPMFSEIVTGILTACPDHAGWLVLPSLFSGNSARRLIVSKIVAECGKSGKKDLEISTRLERIRVVIEALVGIARHGKTEKSLNLSKLSECKEGQRLIKSGINVIVPLQENIGYAAALRVAAGGGSMKAPTISSWKDVVMEISSKARPKKLTLIDSEGKEHMFLCKHDSSSDMRKDARMMEFANIINTEVFGRSAKSAELSLRTYSVIPLSEDTALIEWIGNLTTVRSAIEEGLKKGGYSKISALLTKDAQEALNGPHSLEVFHQFLIKYPAVLPAWLVATFPEPNRWWRARQKYTKSLAVWSMVGFVVGLGDRHCENILLDQSTGEVVHVDFDCIFGKGMLLTTPELVPFRLTQNMIATMGLTGVEGVFRKTCEFVMKLLRKNKPLLLSTLSSFTADPSIDWNVKNGTQAAVNKRAQEALRVIDRKLSGMVDCGPQLTSGSDERLLQFSEKDAKTALGKDRGTGLSVEAQVDELIKAATCNGNLAKMYIGWLPMF